MLLKFGTLGLPLFPFSRAYRASDPSSATTTSSILHGLETLSFANFGKSTYTVYGNLQKQCRIVGNYHQNLDDRLIIDSVQEPLCECGFIYK